MNRKCLVLALVPVFFALAGAARADELTPESLFTAFDRGGKVMWAILAVSIVGCAFALERLVSIRRNAQIPPKLMADLREALVRGGVPEGREVLKGAKSAMGRVMSALLSRNGASRRELESALEEEGTRILVDLQINLRPIGLIASVAPLLGLLGTVFGLIAAFRTAAELGMDDPRNFAAGIYEALYTTAFGLVVAIPFLLVYHALKNRADNIMREVEDRALAFIANAYSRAEAARSRGNTREQYAEVGENEVETAEPEPESVSTAPAETGEGGEYGDVIGRD